MSNAEQARNQLRAIQSIIEQAQKDFSKLNAHDYRQISVLWSLARNLSTNE